MIDLTVLLLLHEIVDEYREVSGGVLVPDLVNFFHDLVADHALARRFETGLIGVLVVVHRLIGAE